MTDAYRKLVSSLQYQFDMYRPNIPILWLLHEVRIDAYSKCLSERQENYVELVGLVFACFDKPFLL